MNALDIKNLKISYGHQTAVCGADISLKEKGIVCLLGESGSGKSSVLKAVMGLKDYRGRITDGSIEIYGEKIVENGKRLLFPAPGKDLGLIQQNPASAFNPIRIIEKQFKETLSSNGIAYDKDLIFEAFEKVGLSDGERILKSCPYELSGGMCQRTAIALIMLLKPRILLCDEVTSALDKDTQKEVIASLKKCREEEGIPLFLVTHDLGFAREIADEIYVMHEGKIVEHGTTDEVLSAPKDAYTKELISAVPKKGVRISPDRKKHDDTEVFLQIEDVSKSYSVNGKEIKALENISFNVKRSEIVGIIGKSGAGKSTLLRMISGIEKPDSGKVLYNGTEVGDLPDNDRFETVKTVFQDAYASFNPVLSVKHSILDAMKLSDKRKGIKRRDRERFDEMVSVGKNFGLESDLFARRPSNLSGGQCQRMAILRAVLTGPSLLLCDEITSALDVTAGRDAVKMISDLCDRSGMTVIFVTHDRVLAENFCDRIISCSRE